MLPYFDAWTVEKELKTKNKLSKIDKDILKSIAKLHKMKEEYDYNSFIEFNLGQDLQRIEKLYPDDYKNHEDYDKMVNQSYETNGKITTLRWDLIDLNERICNDAKKHGIIDDSDLKMDDIARYRKSKSTSKPKKAKPTFRTGESQGRGMIRNMNKITGIAVKRFK